MRVTFWGDETCGHYTTLASTLMKVTITIELPERLAVHFRWDPEARTDLLAYMKKEPGVGVLLWAERYICKRLGPEVPSVESVQVDFVPE